jgi:hypothetical protein
VYDNIFDIIFICADVHFRYRSTFPLMTCKLVLLNLGIERKNSIRVSSQYFVGDHDLLPPKGSSTNVH